MLIALVFDRQQQFLHIKASGQISINDFESALQVILSSEEYPPDIATLWDLQNFDFSVISSKFEKSIIDIHKKYPARGKTRFAMLVSSQLGVGLSMMYKSLSSMHGIPHEFKVFQNIDDAKSWLTGQQP
ncbi:MAG: STAS/SEC14 domain-containing protein [Desulfuromusa sp.]|jgi:hypothetical protein|nr:STAS/SEC14 domain-containing protein [Desulfuromusa sp.]